MLYSYNDAIVFSINTLKFILKTETACNFLQEHQNQFLHTLLYMSRTAKTLVFEILTPDNIKVLRSYKKIL